METFAPTVAEATDLVGSGERTVTDLTRDALDRAEATQSSLNAFTLIDRGHALALAEAQSAAGTLTGVTFAVKDLIDQAGLPNTCGGSFEPAIPETDAPVVTRLINAGAVPIGRTGLHEFAFGFDSENHWFGPVRNPWDTSLSVGGSSGGSAAAVAAGVCTAALGTDTGGSVRVPAALCGIFGLKVTHGRVPISGVYPLATSLDTVGPLARNVADIEALYDVIAGYDPSDPWSVDRPLDGRMPPPGLETLTLGVPRPWVDDSQVTAAVAEAWHAMKNALANRGVRLVDLDTPSLVPATSGIPSGYWEVAGVHRDRLLEFPEKYGPNTRNRLGRTFAATGKDYLASLAQRRVLAREFARALHSVDAIVTPATGVITKPIGQSETTLSSGTTVHYRTPIARFSAMVNEVGLPGFTLPANVLKTSPPAAIQLVGPRWSERRLLAIAAQLENAGICVYRRPQ
jgi:aspartyl-tRNA(Asn)/glutamyl-tRNA(Gln) amidotransferase subunit A